uniref:acyl-CoA dehydrogenase family protein n=1 Tax=unclassified Rhodococcus (in: high G+C Gram-positive bacteria) TaxID=192944 RepID=UPI000690A376|nr:MULTISPECIES: acyl-CoA dehydrogenase family protein [Rhodococcus]
MVDSPKPSARENDSLRTLRSEVRGFLRSEIAAGGFIPTCDSWMSGFEPEFSAKLGDRGWLGITIPVSYGGHGGGQLERVTIAEELLANGAPVAAHWIADRQMAPSLLNFGTPEQKEMYLPGIALGRTFFAIGMSEPEAGSDLAAVRTRAIKDGNGWRLTGTKLWTTGAHLAHAMVVLARTDGDVHDRQKGLSQFVVDLPHPNVEIRPIHSIDGQAHFNEVVFHDAALSSSALLGERGAGWSQVMSELAYERSGPERYLSTMPLLRAWGEILRINGSTAEQRQTLGTLTARAWTLRQMSHQVAHELAAGRRPDSLAAMVKDLGSTFEGDLVEGVRRSSRTEPRIGADPFAELLAQSVLHMPAFTLRGGTNEILRSIIGRGMGLR